MTLHDEALSGRSKQTGLPQVPMEPIGRHRGLQQSQLQDFATDIQGTRISCLWNYLQFATRSTERLIPHGSHGLNKKGRVKSRRLARCVRRTIRGLGCDLVILEISFSDWRAVAQLHLSSPFKTTHLHTFTQADIALHRELYLPHLDSLINYRKDAWRDVRVSGLCTNLPHI